MTSKEKKAMLDKNGELYLFDDFLEVILKVVVTESGEEKYLKWKGRKEKIVELSNETACDIYIDNETKIVTKEFYERY